MHHTYRSAVQRYHEVQSQTASPGELLLALYDGLFRFLNVAVRLLREQKRGPASQQIQKAHAIITELYLALDDKRAPEFCQNVRSVYAFCLDRLMHASLRSDESAVLEVIRVLTPLREAWVAAVPTAQAEKAKAER